MKKNIYIAAAFVLGFLVLCISRSFGQKIPFRNDIAAFKKMDSIQPPPRHAILFTGSSSFTKWTDLAAYFPAYTVINRGFGGATIPDVIHYAGDIIFPYQPKQIVIYCGDNDLASSDTVTAQVVCSRFLQLYQLIRSHLKKVDILYVSIKPSPSRERLMPRIEEANKYIADFLRKEKHAAFADIYHPMLNSEGHPVEDLFVGDKLHMNPKGYSIWQQIIQPYLVR